LVVQQGHAHNLLRPVIQDGWQRLVTESLRLCKKFRSGLVEAVSWLTNQ
jgi:hypothetical protein